MNLVCLTMLAHDQPRTVAPPTIRPTPPLYSSAMTTLARAIAIAAQAHEGQVDKAGDPYILHPLRMMFSLESEDEKIAAILHDVVEDTPWTFKQLRGEGFEEAVLTALKHLTKRRGEDYMGFVKRAARNPIARRVKIADLEDNMCLTRMGVVRAKDLKRVERYHRAWTYLRGLPDDAGR